MIDRLMRAIANIILFILSPVLDAISGGILAIANTMVESKGRQRHEDKDNL